MAEETNTPKKQYNTIDELREAALGANYSQKEIDDFINLGKRFAAKPVLTALIEVVKEGIAKGCGVAEANRLEKKILSKMPYKDCGSIQMEFEETPHKLNICLSIVPKDYRAAIDIPDEKYGPEILTKFNFLKQIAMAFYQQFKEENAELYNRIVVYRHDVDFAALVNDPDSLTTLFIDPDCAKRIGIFPYYLNGSTNQPFYKGKK